MTSVANSPAPSTTPASQPTVATSTPLSGPSSPPLSAGQGVSRPNYAQAASGTLKKLQSPAVSGNTSPSGTPGIRPNSTRSPVNGKPPPAVPSVITPTVSNSNVNSNGSTPTTSHSRKSSLVGSHNWPNGVQMPNGRVGGPPPIHFGSVSAASGQSGAPNSAPHNLAPNQNPRGSSPQSSPSPVPQPAATGGATPANNRIPSGNINFGQINEGTNNQSVPGRPNNMPGPGGPPVAPGGGPGSGLHARRDSSHSQHAPDMSQMVPGRGMPGPGPGPGVGRGRGGGHQGGAHQAGNQYGQPYPYNGGYAQPGVGQFQRNPSQGRNGYGPMAGQFQGPGMPYPNNQHPGRGGPNSRSPNMQHAHMSQGSLPGTPQMQSAHIVHPGQMAQGSPYHQYAQMAPQFPMQNPPYGVDPNMYSGYPQPNYYVQAPYMQTGHPPPSPRPYNNSPYATPYGVNMARSGSAMSLGHDVARPPSSMGNVSTPSFQPAQPVVPAQPPQAPSPSPSPVKKPAARTSHALKIVDPSTLKILNVNPATSSTPPRSPAPTVTNTVTTPVIVSSDPNAVSTKSKAQHSRTDSVKVTDADKLQKAEAMRLAVAKKLKDEEDEARRKAEEEERIKKEAEEAEAKKKKEEEERIAREKEEAERKRIEEEERLAREEEERKAEEARIAKEKEEQALREAEEKLRLEAEAEKERIAAEARAKAEAAAAKEKAAAEAEDTDDSKADTPEIPATPELGDGAASTPDRLASSLSKMALAEDANDTTTTPAYTEMPPPTTKGRGKPAPLNLSVKTTTEAPLPSAQLSALRSAKFIDSLDHIKYPANILSPNPALNANAPQGKFKYEKDFLMQFQGVFTEKPDPMWDQKMREIVGESESARPQSARPQSSMGRQPSRNLGLTTPMGAFGGGSMGGNKNPFVGGMDASRYSNANRPMGMGGGLGGNPFANQQGFRPAPMVRTNSSNSLSGGQGNIPQSPRIGSQGGSKSKKPRANPMERQNSNKPPMEHREHQGPGAPTIKPEDVKPLTFSTGGWKPRTVGKAKEEPALPGTDDNRMAPDMVQRKVKAALNKMTPEKFDKISDQILEIAAQSKLESDGRTLRQVIQLTFEKATDEPNFSSMYAKFCKRMLETMDPNVKDENIKDKNGVIVTGGALFRKYLLNRCQEEFERGWKVNLPPKPEGASATGGDETEMMSEEYYKAMAAKRRGLGLIQFIGELYKLGMLTERIMHECIKKLLDFGNALPEEEEVESLTKLLKTIGRQLDLSDKSRPSMNVYFDRINTIIKKGDLPSRMQFMLMDVVDLRNKNWVGKDTDKGPKTITEIREQALLDKAKQDAERAQQQRSRPSMGRGDARSFSSNYVNNPEQWQSKTMDTSDLRKLQDKTRRNVSAATQSFGPTSMFANRSGSGNNRRTSQLGNVANADSASSSRTGTPPAPGNRETAPHTNMFSLLQDQTSPSLNDDKHDASQPGSQANSPPQREAAIHVEKRDE